MPQSTIKFGIRAKLIVLFVGIKVLPLILMAYVAWQGVHQLGLQLAQETLELADEVNTTVLDISKRFSKESVRALDERAREELERLTTDTARSVADFLYDRDRDILMAALLAPSQTQYSSFLNTRTRLVIESGKWQLAADQRSWVPQAAAAPDTSFELAASANAENVQDFHARPPESVLRTEPAPLYHEMTYVDLNGQERIKISATSVLPKSLRNVSNKANTWSKAETYFAALKRLKPGQIYVSNVIGPYVPSYVTGKVTPESLAQVSQPFQPEKQAFSGQENPVGTRFQGLVRWATPVVQHGQIVGYVTLALDHQHIRSFTDTITPTADRYTALPDAESGNYAFMWDNHDRNIAHPRHHSIVGFDPVTGEYATPWLEDNIYKRWKASKLPLQVFLRQVPSFDQQSREKKPAAELSQAGLLGLDCRYLNFAPQCQGWYDLTRNGGSGSFLIHWAGLWKRSTAAIIPYFTGQYGQSPRGFGFITIGANVGDFHAPAVASAQLMNDKMSEFSERLQRRKADFHDMISSSVNITAASLAGSTLIMVVMVIAVAIWLAFMLTQRVTNLITGLSRIEAGDLSFRFKPGANDELGHLNHSLNTMADSVQASLLRSEEARDQAEKNSQIKSDFVANVSHELRTPLNGILGFSEIIRDDAKDEMTREFAQTIHQSGQHLLAVVNDMLDVAKIEAGYLTLDPSPVNVLALLEEVAQLHGKCAQSKGLHMCIALDEQLPLFWCTDPMRLRQIVNNLMSNAVKFTQEGQITLCAHGTGQQLVIGVRDTGPGIAPDLHEAVFERFHQARPFITREHGGTGLGLALVRELVGLMGGQLRLTSALGAGAYFEVSIPELSQAPPAADPER